MANGSGTATANVTNVAVTCVLSYTIGGTVTGVVGTGLVLQDSATLEQLSLPAAWQPGVSVQGLCADGICVYRDDLLTANESDTDVRGYTEHGEWDGYHERYECSDNLSGGNLQRWRKRGGASGCAVQQWNFD